MARDREPNRREDLVLKAAKAMIDGMDPFSTTFLSEHNVTLDECYTMGEDLAMAGRMWVYLQTQADDPSRQLWAHVTAEALVRFG